MIVEVIPFIFLKFTLNFIYQIMFGSLFRMPESPIIEIAYASIFIELCKLQPSNMPQVLALATELLFEKLDHMTKDRILYFWHI